MQTNFPKFSDLYDLSESCNSIAYSMNRLTFVLDFAKRSNDLDTLHFVDRSFGQFVDDFVDKFYAYENDKKENQLDKDSQLDN